MSKGSTGHPVKTMQLSLQFPRNSAGEKHASHAVKSNQLCSFGAATAASSPSPLPSSGVIESRSSKPHFLSSELLLRSPSESAGSPNGTRARGSTWDMQTSSLPLGIALLLQEPQTTIDRVSPRVSLDPLPFSKSRARHFVMERMSNVISGSQSPTMLAAKDLKSYETSEPIVTNGHSVSAPTNRSEAMLLADTFRLLREQLQLDCAVADTFKAAETQAENGKLDIVWKLLKEELAIAVSTFSELSRQVRCECAERAVLLEQVGCIFQRIIVVLYDCCNACVKHNQGSSKHMAEAADRESQLQQQIDNLKDQLADKEKQLLSYNAKVMESGVSLAVSESHSRLAKENFANARR
jgi:hypothetical protein